MNAVELTDIRKVFGATVALDRVTTAIHAGSAHALLGENGAGKSTTVKMLSGLLRPDEGRISIFGNTVDLDGPRAAHAAGIQTAFQEMTQIPDLTVTQNLLLPYEPRNAFGLLARRRAKDRAAEILTGLGLDQIHPDAVMRDLDLALRQKVEIARAVSRDPKVLLLDEPTSALTGKDMDWLGGIIERLKAQGTTIIFISHRMLEVREYCDRLTVLRNGMAVHEGLVEDVSDEEIVRLIIGRSLSATFPEVTDCSLDGPPALEARHLTVGDGLRDASFALKKGEVLGVAGLQGMGQLELFNACFGVSLASSGVLLVDGKQTAFVSPTDAVAAGIKMGFIPEDRKTEGLFLGLTGRENISLPVIGDYARFGIIDVAAEARDVSLALATMQVEERAARLAASAFSGGNQQKMILARWHLAESRILLMYDPTRGVDIGTKAEIYRQIREFVAAGHSVLLYSTEIEEVVNLSDRVLVFYGKRIAVTLERAEISEHRIMEIALGQAQH